jgi:hypothetical protein
MVSSTGETILWQDIPRHLIYIDFYHNNKDYFCQDLFLDAHRSLICWSAWISGRILQYRFLHFQEGGTVLCHILLPVCACAMLAA